VSASAPTDQAEPAARVVGHPLTGHNAPADALSRAPLPLGPRRVQRLADSASMTPVGPRAGYHTVTPRLVVGDVAAQVDFLRRVFGATGEFEPGHPAEIHIGDSLIMISPATERDPFPGFLYVYVEDADQAYENAVNAGAASLEAPLDTPYGDRRAMVRDVFGNVYQIAHPMREG